MAVKFKRRSKRIAKENLATIEFYFKKINTQQTKKAK
jgi:hypothetical protein